jgi:hypothetical protein
MREQAMLIPMRTAQFMMTIKLQKPLKRLLK